MVHQVESYASTGRWDVRNVEVNGYFQVERQLLLVPIVGIFEQNDRHGQDHLNPTWRLL